jgi:DNA repair photolyase
MTDGATIETLDVPTTGGDPGRRLPALRYVRRRGPLFRPARSGPRDAGLYGFDLTAGCALGCAFCFVRGTARDPGPDRLLFDPEVVGSIGPALDRLESPPRRVVLSPSSDPLPPIREVRLATIRVIEQLLDRGIEVVLMTRGRVTRDVARLLGSRPERMAPPGARRLKGIGLLLDAGVPVEARIEPLIPGLTDTRENLRPLLRELGRIGVRDAVAHYAFLQPAILPPIRAALTPLGHAERLVDLYEGGPVFSVGEAGATKHLPIEARREGLARVIAWGAEAGLIVTTGSAQNPDLPRLDAIAPPTPPPADRRRTPPSKSRARSVDPRPAAPV